MASKTKKPPSEKCPPPFKSDHNLAFEAAPWDMTIGNDKEWQLFKVGTCNGVWRCTDAAYEILAVINDKPGNGHFNDVLQWFEQSCRRDKRLLRIREVWNINFKTRLLQKEGFKVDGPMDVVKTFL